MTREMDYALRALRALYPQRQLSAAEIARQEHIPAAVTRKVLKKLHAAGLIDSRRGSGGGYFLTGQCEALYLADLFRVLGGGVYLNLCQQPGYQCENRPKDACGLCRELSRIQAVLGAELRQTPLSAIFQEL